MIALLSKTEIVGLRHTIVRHSKDTMSFCISVFCLCLLIMPYATRPRRRGLTENLLFRRYDSAAATVAAPAAGAGAAGAAGAGAAGAGAAAAGAAAACVVSVAAGAARPGAGDAGGFNAGAAGAGRGGVGGDAGGVNGAACGAVSAGAGVSEVSFQSPPSETILETSAT